MGYKFWGWVSAIILALLISPFLLVRINKKFFKSKSKNFLELVKFLRKLHKPLGVLLLASGFYHGYLVLGKIRMHTGVVLYVTMAITIILGLLHYRRRNKNIFKMHKIIAALTIAMFVLHFFKPYAFS